MFGIRENARFGQSYARQREQLLRRVKKLLVLDHEEFAWNSWEDGYRQKQRTRFWEEESFQVVALRWLPKATFRALKVYPLRENVSD